MKHDPRQAIRRYPDGSIDTAYYLKRGRSARSRAANDSVTSVRRSTRKLAARLLARVSGYLAAYRTSLS